MSYDWADFIRAVIPQPETTADEQEPHYYCVGTGVDRPSTQHFLGHIEDVIIRANALEHQGVSGGAAYVCVAMLSQKKRKQQNVIGAKCIALDIDIRSASPQHYPTQPEAVRALFTAIRDAHIPHPSYVINSGRGLHVYWALTEMITGAAYMSLGEGLIAALGAHDPKLVSDTSVSKNSVTFVRLVGSTNNKSTPPTQVGYYTVSGAHIGCEVLYTPQRMHDALRVNRSVSAANMAPLHASIPAHIQARMRAPQSPAATTQATPPAPPAAPRVVDVMPPLSSANDLFTSCAVVRHIYQHRADDVTSPDYVSYPTWRSMIALLALTDDADRAVHIWSEGAPSYTVEATDAQLQIERRNQRNITGAITCAQLCSELPQQRQLCAQCEHFNPSSGSPYRAAYNAARLRDVTAANAKVTTAAAPVLLASDAGDCAAPAPAPAADVDSIYVATIDDKSVHDMRMLQFMVENNRYVPMTKLGVDKDAALFAGTDLPLSVNANGVLMGSLPDKNGGFKPVRVANGPVWPVRYIQRPDTDRTDIQVCAAKYEGGQWLARLTSIPYTAVGGALGQFKAEMMGIQVVMSYDMKAQAQFHKWFTARCAAMHSGDALTLYDKFGWHDVGGSHVFVLGKFCLRPANGVRAASLDDNLTQMADQHMRLKGSMQGARSVLNFIWHHGTDEAKMALMLGAGAPMTYASSTAGAYINLWGANGSGKSLLANIVSGVWGNGSRNSAHITTKDTVNYRYAVLSSMQCLPVIHDEATQLHTSVNESDAMGQYLYEVSEGKGKGRAVKSGAAAPVHNWRTVVIATSNACIAHNYAGLSDERAAKLARAYELHIDRPIVDLPTPAETNRCMERLGMAMEASSGVAGVAIAQYMVDSRAALEQKMQSVTQQFMSTERSTDAKTRIARAVQSIAAVGGGVLSALGLWDATEGDIMTVVQRVNARVMSAAETAQGSPIEVLFEMMNDMTEYTAHVCTTAAGTTAFPARNASSTPDGVKIEPKFHLRMRVDQVAGADSVRVTVKGTVFDAYMQRRAVDPTMLLRDLQAGGFTIRREVVAIHEGISMPSRSDFSTESILPPIECVVFSVKTDTIAAAHSTGPAQIIVKPIAQQMKG